MTNNQDTSTSKLLAELEEKESGGEYIQSIIKTDERVIARITDGIYRQPGSALRELIANAYDADATLVTIETDAPRFDRIVIRDNGLGLSKATLAYILHHIGGSAKRTKIGESLGIVDSQNVTHSKAKRKLIGKIGIGLFSVAQLTPHFQIISKVKGEKYRRVADVLLTTYTEASLAKAESSNEFSAGTVSIWSVPADDLDTQGTDIILMDLKKHAKNMLRSEGLWAAIRDSEGEVDDEDKPESLRSPTYHIGEVDLTTGDTVERTASLPWLPVDDPKTRFSKLVKSVVTTTSERATPKLSIILDNYLQMLWSLGLALPVEYVDGHPLNIVPQDKIKVYKLSNARKGQATSVSLPAGDSVATVLGLAAAKNESPLPFQVIIDGIEILRPISLEGLPEEKDYAFKDRLLLVGQCSPDLSKIPEQYRGGDLSFEAYFYWSPKIAPKDHNGVLVRINDASGTLFDETFMKYQVSEQTRLRQIIAEIFVSNGLDAALNIDRESFNYAHPHYIYLQRWVHEALRQLTNLHKKLARDLRKATLEQKSIQALTDIQLTAKEEWEIATGDKLLTAPQVIFERQASIDYILESNSVFLNRDEIFPPPKRLRQQTPKSSVEQQDLEQKLVGITQILVAYGLLDGMPQKRQTSLMRAISRVISSGSTK